jgi:hypothetical protein
MAEETLADITDLNRLKALAYDTLANIEGLQGNLNLINQRIREVQTPGQVIEVTEAPAKPVHDGRVTRSPRAKPRQPRKKA